MLSLVAVEHCITSSITSIRRCRISDWPRAGAQARSIFRARTACEPVKLFFCMDDDRGFFETLIGDGRSLLKLDGADADRLPARSRSSRRRPAISFRTTPSSSA